MEFNKRDFRKDKPKPLRVRIGCGVKNKHFLKGEMK